MLAESHMEDDDAELARWRTVCPELFDELGALGISEYMVLDSLQRIESGQLASIDEARSAVLQQHKEREAMRQRVLQRQQSAPADSTPQQAEAPAVAEDEGVGVGEGEGEGGATDACLPAWVELQADFREAAERLWHTLAVQYVPLAGDDPSVEKAVREPRTASPPAPPRRNTRGRFGHAAAPLAAAGRPCAEAALEP